MNSEQDQSYLEPKFVWTLSRLANILATLTYDEFGEIFLM